MINNKVNIDVIKRKSQVFGIVSIVLAIVGILSGLGGKTQVKYLNNILFIFTLISGIIILTAKNETDLSKIGIKLVWAGWIMLPLNLGGFLLNLSPYYSEGLNLVTWIILLLSRLIASCFGLYIIFYSHKKTGTQVAP